ncbi:Hypothetical protein D9617_4g002800 [Elsinoe fawcettii]|nr:Hypothetical protein D9617_4g002800 [Elsinoe fawcettii]
MLLSSRRAPSKWLLRQAEVCQVEQRRYGQTSEWWLGQVEKNRQQQREAEELKKSATGPKHASQQDGVSTRFPPDEAAAPFRISKHNVKADKQSRGLAKTPYDTLLSPLQRKSGSLDSDRSSPGGRGFNILRDRIPSRGGEEGRDNSNFPNSRDDGGESRSSGGGSIPFEHLTPERIKRNQDSTMTRRERGTLKKLQDRGATVAPPEPYVARASDPVPPVRRHTSILDNLLDEIKANERKTATYEFSRLPVAKDPEAFKAMVEEVKTRRKEIRIEQEQRQKTILRKLSIARSDFAVWRLLQDDILKTVADMYLDDSRVEQEENDEVELPKRQVLTMESFGNIFATQLRTAAAVLRTNFPSSPIRGVIISELRKLGPTAFALGITTDLYNEMLDYVAIQNEDYTATLDVLNEMERDVIEPNHMTLSILMTARRSQNSIRQGKLGHGARIALMTTSRHMSVVHEIGQKLREMYTYLHDKEADVDSDGTTRAKSPTDTNESESG